METQEILRTVIEVDGHVSQLDLRDTGDLRYDMVLGLDFGVERDLQIRCRARECRCGEHGEWSPLVTTREKSRSKSKAVNYRIINVLVGGYCDGIICSCLLGAGRTKTLVS